MADQQHPGRTDRGRPDDRRRDDEHPLAPDDTEENRQPDHNAEEWGQRHETGKGIARGGQPDSGSGSTEPADEDDR